MKKNIFRLVFAAVIITGTISFLSNYAYGSEDCGTHGNEKYCITCATGDKNCIDDAGNPRCKID